MTVHMQKKLLYAGACLALISMRTVLAFGVANAPGFDITLSPKVATQPLNGRLFVFLQSAASPNHREPRFGPDWYAASPFFGFDVGDLRRGNRAALTIMPMAFPINFRNWRRAIIVCKRCSISIPIRRSLAAELEIFIARSRKLILILATRKTCRWFWTTLLKRNRGLIRGGRKRFCSAVNGSANFTSGEIVQQCGVVLPASYYSQPQHRYPVIYMIPGFGGSHRDALQYASRPPAWRRGGRIHSRISHRRLQMGTSCICRQCDQWSARRKPIWELIPEIDRRFHTVANRDGRFLYGHSSGGWSSLWLMVNYPDVFGRVWSISPDPVDFRDWQGIDLYADPPLNMYVDPAGNRRPIARQGDQVMLWYDSFTKMDDTLKRGGQLRSFEATFSPVVADGEPRMPWIALRDRSTRTLPTRGNSSIFACKLSNIGSICSRYWRAVFTLLWAIRIPIISTALSTSWPIR